MAQIIDRPVNIRGETQSDNAGRLQVLMVSAAFTLAGAVLVAVAWVVMFAASVRLSPDPLGDAQLALMEAAGGDPELAGYIASGMKLYSTTCIACHGQSGAGMPGNGKPLAGSPFVNSLDDEALLQFVQRGRDPGDPNNTTGVAMPPKGGNPALSEDDILDVISYLRTLPGNKPVASQTEKSK